jgi:hypothetical protein
MTRVMLRIKGFYIKNIKKKLRSKSIMFFLQSYTQESWVWLQRLTQQ